MRLRLHPVRARHRCGAMRVMSGNCWGERVTRVQMRREAVVMDHCADPTEFREYWKRNYGPTIAVYRFTEDRPERVDDLDRDLLSLLTTWSRAAEDGRNAYDAEYLLITAIKR